MNSAPSKIEMGTFISIKNFQPNLKLGSGRRDIEQGDTGLVTLTL
jgi:hypothetical protein